MKRFNKEKFLKHLGSCLNRLRLRKGLGQDALTQAAGLSKGALSKIENGIVDPRASTLTRLVRVLGVELGPCLAEADKKAG